MLRQTLLAVLITVVVLVADTTADVNVLVLSGNIRQVEFSVLEKFTNVDGEKVSYTQTTDRDLPGLENADILWIGQSEICENAYFFNAKIEDKIKNFVESGGIVISIGQDSDDGRPCEVGWLTAPIVGVERGGTELFQVTNAPKLNGLFEKPNRVNSAHFDDAWTQPDKSYIVLATINNGQDIGIALLKHGKGWYVLTSLQNEGVGEVVINAPLMEKLIPLRCKVVPNFSGQTSQDAGNKLGGDKALILTLDPMGWSLNGRIESYPRTFVIRDL